MAAFSRSPFIRNRYHKISRRNFVKVRFLLVEVIKKILLGSIASGAPSTIIRSLDEKSYNDSVRKHIADRQHIYSEKFEYYDFPESYPPQFRRYGSFETKSIFLLKDVIASPDTGAIWLPEGVLLQESVGPLYRILGWGNALYDTCLPAKEAITDSEIVCCPPTGYYHWLLEVMPNLINAVKAYPDTKVLLPSGSPGYIREALALLFRDEFTSRLIVSDEPVRVMRIAMTQFEEYPGFVRSQDIDTLRIAFLSEDAALSEQTALSSHPSRIYISRSRTAKRSIGNEKDVEKALTEVGIEIVYLEELAFEQQVRLFTSADVIIAPHGAGLANLVWAEPSSRVLEIFPHGFFNDCYARLSISRSISYDYFNCAQDSNSHGVIDTSEIIAWLNLSQT